MTNKEFVQMLHSDAKSIFWCSPHYKKFEWAILVHFRSNQYNSVIGADPVDEEVAWENAKKFLENYYGAEHMSYVMNVDLFIKN